MWLLVGFPVAAFVLVLLLFKNEDLSLKILVSCMAVAIAGWLGFMFALGMGITHSYHLDREFELVTLKDTPSNDPSGAFFLGIGGVDSELNFYYVYYYEDEDGSVRLGKINSKHARIYEEDREDAVIKIYEKPALSRFGLTFRHSRPTKAEIFVPKGTILPGYRLDLE